MLQDIKGETSNEVRRTSELAGLLDGQGTQTFASQTLDESGEAGVTFVIASERYRIAGLRGRS